ncbi:MAG: ROK family protein [Solirubrobacterales bacterium]
MYYVGVDIGGTKIAAGLITKDGYILHKDSIATLRERNYSDIIKDIGELVLDVINKGGTKIQDVEYIGIGTPGTVNIEEGKVIYCNSINLTNVHIKDEIQKYIRLPVFVDNDANCAAIAESVIGSASEFMNSITLTLGTGIGCGIILNGKIFRGFSSAAGEAGHMVIEVDGKQCTCGRKGCFEAYASATALINDTKKAAIKYPDSIINNLVKRDLNLIDGKTAFDAAAADDKAGIMVIDNYIKYLAEGTVNLINILRPEVVVIGGGISTQGENLMQPLRKLIQKGIYGGDELPKITIRAASLVNDAGIIGAAMLGRMG